MWITAILAAVVIGQGFVLWRRANTAVDPAPLGASTNPATESDAVTEAQRAEVMQLEKENARLLARLDEIAAVQIPAMSALPANASDREKFLRAEVEARRMAEQRPPDAFGLHGELNEEFCDFYGIDREGRARLEESFWRAIGALQRLSSANARGRYVDGDTYELSVAPFPEEGGVVYDELMKEIREVLGASKNAAFSALSGEAVERRLGGLGTQAVELTVRSAGRGKGYQVRSPQLRTSFLYIEIFDGHYPQLAHLLRAELREQSTRADFEKIPGEAIQRAGEK